MQRTVWHRVRYYFISNMCPTLVLAFACDMTGNNVSSVTGASITPVRFPIYSPHFHSVFDPQGVVNFVSFLSITGALLTMVHHRRSTPWGNDASFEFQFENQGDASLALIGARAMRECTFRLAKRDCTRTNRLVWAHQVGWTGFE
jgi:hypothetical protein